MSKDMLGIAVRKLVTLPSQTLGVVCDLLEKLADPEWVEATKRFLRTRPAPEPSTLAIPQYPANGVIFELTLNFDATEADPTQMVRVGGYGPSEKWRFVGKKMCGIQTRCFKLVQVGACRNFNEVLQNLAQYGEIVGQSCAAFKVAFPKPDGNGPIGIADASWVDPDGKLCFPFVRSDGSSRFFWADIEFGGSWRWLVPASK